MRKIGKLLLVRSGYAASAALVCSLLPLIGVPFGFLATIIVGFVTLCRGPRSGLFVLVWVALPALALLYLHRMSMLDTLLADCVLVWLLAYVLRRLGSWRWVFEIATLLGVLLIIGVHIAFPDVQSWWTKNLTKYLADLHSITSWRLTATQTDDLVKGFAPIASGAVVLVGLFWTWLMLMMARWWQTSIYFPGRLLDEFIGVRNRMMMGVAVLLGIVGYVLKQSIVMDIFPVLLFPMMMGGLSFLHYVAAIKKGFVILVVIVYLGILFLPFVVVALLALIGFLDIWINFRKFLKMKEGVV